MNITEFTHASEDALNEYLTAIAHWFSTGQFKTSVPNPVPSFPSMMVITVLPNHFAFELVGGRRNNRNLKVVKRKLDDTTLYFSQFNFPPNVKPMVELGHPDGAGYIEGIALITENARQELDRRFPGATDMHPSRIVAVGDDFGPAIDLDEDAKFLCLDNVLAVNALDQMVRIRQMRLTVVANKRVTAQEYRSYLRELLEVKHGANLIGVRLISGDKAEAVLKAAQFANLFLMNKLHETSIGTFIDQHRDILLSALEAKAFVTEPYLPWVVTSPDPEEHAVNPDLFVQRADGYWDIYDLKHALLNRRDVTTGRRNRRRFVSDIEDGLAQLAHYREFLSIPEHAVLAKEKYGVTFNKPRYTLVVGSYENIDADKVADARRRFPDLEIIDYDSLLQLYLIRKGYFQNSKSVTE